MAIDSNKVVAGAPDQSTTGAILRAPLTTAIPADVFASTLSGFTDSGYVSEDGIKLKIDESYESIKDWSGATVKKLLSEFSGEVTYQHLEVSEEAFKDAFGAANVSVTAATATAGKKIRVNVGARTRPEERKIFRMKDGKARVVVVLPRSQVVGVDEYEFKASDAIKTGVTVSAHPDSDGNSIIIYTDDGIFTA